jgi:hypothetical protein
MNALMPKHTFIILKKLCKTLGLQNEILGLLPWEQ